MSQALTKDVPSLRWSGCEWWGVGLWEGCLQEVPLPQNIGHRFWTLLSDLFLSPDALQTPGHVSVGAGLPDAPRKTAAALCRLSPSPAASPG